MTPGHGAGHGERDVTPGILAPDAGLDDESFTVSLIPETLERTNLGAAQPGRRVNLEVDVLAKYVERLMGAVRA